MDRRREGALGRETTEQGAHSAEDGKPAKWKAPPQPLRKRGRGRATDRPCGSRQEPTAVADPTESNVSLPTALAQTDYNSQKPPPAVWRLRGSTGRFLIRKSAEVG
ncbi:hypothetical protein P7K49_006320 [Saguinus oedipus]|uniref:Uncharacterized protein n=1 Tax=Saguinus oedipus TaxID=9490 RepID=A0ABQ9W235_SAGOE|nr:hypothetical protein P7K49_006320 [Saguinus oedipus]